MGMGGLKKSIMGSLKSIIGTNFGNIPKAFWVTF